MIYPLVRELAEDGIPVTVTCRVLKFSPQGYYQWRKVPWSSRDYENAYLTNELINAHSEDPNFGYRFLADELEQQGEQVSERRVWRLCSEMKVWSAFVKKSRSGKKPGPPVHDDLVQGERTLVHGHHRALDEYRQALHVLNRGRLFGSHRGLLNRRAHDTTLSVRGTSQRHRAAPASRNHLPQRSRIAR
jgi:putative transposase